MAKSVLDGLKKFHLSFILEYIPLTLTVLGIHVNNTIQRQKVNYLFFITTDMYIH